MSLVHRGEVKGILDPTAEDVHGLLACNVHIGTKNLHHDMRHYVSSRNKDGVHIINLSMFWEKLMLAARIIAAIENPQDICVVSGRPFGQRAVLKFAFYTGSQHIAGRYTPGAFTNHVQRRVYRQSRLLVVSDPRIDHQPVTEAGYVNLPVIALCDTDSPLKNIDCAIPCNNRSRNSIALVFWLLAREVLRMRGSILRPNAWEVKPDLFLYRDAEETTGRKEETEQPAAAPAVAADFAAVEPTVQPAAFPGTVGEDLGFGVVQPPASWPAAVSA